MTITNFHPAVAAWLERSFAAPTPAQRQAWPAIQGGQDVLIAAPTGSGKTLAAFLAAIDALVRKGVEGRLEDATQVVYVSPLKALSNDIQRNLQAPLAGIGEVLREQHLPEVQVRTAVRTGDTPSAERERMRRHPPHIIVTTPESLYVLLGSASGRAMLKTTRTVIVDEIHALAPNKRGAHLLLSLERLQALCEHPLQRVGLSATQKPIDAVARFLVGCDADGAPRACTIIDAGHRRARDLALEVPSSPLEAVMSAEVWGQVYDRLSELIAAHRTTLVFVNTRRLAERVTRHISERLGPEHVAAHHGSLSKEQRFDSERRLQRGQLKALVATASLELGIDIGEVDLVCQIGSPRSIASFLQRVGRSGHAVGATPKGRLFPLSRDDLVECAALIDSVDRGELDQLLIPEQPLDVLAQQIVAEVSAREWQEGELFGWFRRAWSYRMLDRKLFATVVRMVAEGFASRLGRRGALIHYDGVNRILRGRRGARLTALTSGGTIPDTADYQVLLEPEAQVIGSVNEDFAVESMAGDIFQLGNISYRILRVERGLVRVEDAKGAPPNIPFWLGEAPGRSDELSRAVSRLRAAAASRLATDPSGNALLDWLIGNAVVARPAAEQLADYLRPGYAALGCLPTQETIVLERFFDEAGGMQLVIHSPYGSRINRAWGLALRKRFCRKFNFELQAAATEDNIVLSLTTAHSFELGEVARYLNSASVREVLVQALLDAPMFTTRWRWVIGVSLALPRYRGGKKVPPQLARMGAEDLLATVFPDQIACAENLVGEREVPDHPLVNQTISDCLTEAMDLEGLERLLKDLESGAVRVISRDLTEPSPLALEVLSARPYAYLDDAPLEERRTQAVMARRWLDAETASAIGRLDAEAIERVRAEAWPDPVNADELHDALVWLGFLRESEAAASWHTWLTELQVQGRAARLHIREVVLWIAAERLPHMMALFAGARTEPDIAAPAAEPREWSPEEALVELVRGRLEGVGPVTATEMAQSLGVEGATIEAALVALEAEGFAMRGRFTPGINEEQWCERRLLARIHRYTVKRLRAEIEPVAAKDFMRFLLDWQRVTGDTRMEGSEALEEIVTQLEGFEAPAGAWESEILAARLSRYDPTWLDDQCLAGRIAWARLRPRNGKSGERRAAPVRSTPITLVPRPHLGAWAAQAAREEPAPLTPNAATVAAFIRDNGASFLDELREGTRLLRSQLEEALAELVALGVVTSDSFGGLRALLVPSSLRKPAFGGTRRRRTFAFGMENAGRWALARQRRQTEGEPAEHIARALLRRYGVVFWRLLEREAAWLPPWRELLRVYRRLEARGEIRGGRFVAGFSGEQFALPEAIGALREARRKEGRGAWVSVSGADPLNLVGIIVAGPKLAALTSHRVLFRDGIAVARLCGREVEFLEELDGPAAWEARNALLRSPAPPQLLRLA
jgi:ATP-dependent helicase Lhr and Lhr-like helicase